MTGEIDVLIVGSGAAGMLAAVVAAEAGQKTVLLSKGQVARSGATATITGDCSVDGRTCVELLGLKADRNDSPEDFFEDTVVGGKFLNDQRLVEDMIAQVGPLVKRMRDAGMRTGDPIRSPGHRTPRGVWISGMELMQALRKLMIKLDIKVREEFFVTDLLLNDGVVAGVAGIDQRTGEIVGLQAKSVVLATGGGMMIYPVQTAPEELTGDGHSMALRAGAELIDMEMVQFLPCTLMNPAIWRGIQFPWVMGPQSGIRAWLLNRFGERFMARWDPVNMEFATRDIISIACMKEIVEGRGGPQGGVFISWAHLPPDIIDFAATWYFRTHLKGNWIWEGFDFAELVDSIKKGRAIEVIPASHFFMGGVAIDRQCASRVPGLFACGEIAGGLHGANRLSGNASSQILVQGYGAGAAAAAYAAKNRHRDIPRAAWQCAREDLEAPLRRDSGVFPHEIKDELQRLANVKVGMLRSGESLEEAFAGVQKLRRESLPRLYCRSRERLYNKEWADAVECRSLLDTLEATTLSALRRQESRGAHYREDFPKQSNAEAPWNGIITLLGEKMIHARRATDTHRMAPPRDPAPAVKPA
ncbi:MAG: FAD-dependent oxidoreductase [Alphaproteobacteria bacterium]|nr:FAD-dependent oxidoreductase [Alphaproteobacteria bacterium]